MFDRLRKALGGFASPAPDLGRPATKRDVSRWAADQQIAIVTHAGEGAFDLGGDLYGHPWRLECGTPTRDYVHGMELRGRADVGADPDAAVMVINRPLQEILEGTTYTAITDTLQTAISSSLPEEMRWLSMYEEMAWPGLPASFRSHFAVVAERIEHAQRWVHAPVVSQLLNVVEGDGGAQRVKSPMVLMLARGKVYLRLEHTQRSLAEIAHARQLLMVAGQSALQNLPPLSVAGPDDESSTPR